MPFRLLPWFGAGVICALCMSSLSAAGQTFKVLVEFDQTHGALPESVTLTQDREGSLWGTTSAGGGFGNNGVVFRVSPIGPLTGTAKFNGSNGSLSLAGIVLGQDNNFYGTTYRGGSNSEGVVFKLSPAGTLTRLVSFDGSNGIGPDGPLVLGTDGNLYGTTQIGGVFGYGTIYKIKPDGTLTTMYNFNSIDGSEPVAGLLLATDGNFYGTTANGGGSTSCPGGCGTVFKITPSGTLTTLHSFSFTDGANPLHGLSEAANGDLYGTTVGGANTLCFTAYSGCGTVFRISKDGALATVYQFTGGANGENPHGPLVIGADANLYGVAQLGGAGMLGTLFRLTPSGVFTLLHSFNGADGSQPDGGLVQHTNGMLYGTAIIGGKNNAGTVYRLDVGLGPYIRAVLNFGKVGSSVQILGTGLTGATSVTFNGTPASFTVRADSFMTAIVPVGASTGQIQVSTPGGTLVTNTSFTVLP